MTASNSVEPKSAVPHAILILLFSFRFCSDRRHQIALFSQCDSCLRTGRDLKYVICIELPDIYRTPTYPK